MNFDCGVRYLTDRLSCSVLTHGGGFEEPLHRDPDREYGFAIKTT